MRPFIFSLALLITVSIVRADEEFVTADPLKAFVYQEYALGSDYFNRGTKDTVVYRCVVDLDHDGRPDIALSEKTIWGNRTGPFEIFLQKSNGNFKFQRTADYESELKALCGTLLESCQVNVYLSTGACVWTKGQRAEATRYGSAEAVGQDQRIYRVLNCHRRDADDPTPAFLAHGRQHASRELNGAL